MASAFTIMAWREMLARILEGLRCQENVSPAWLVNPATKRRLKLDLLYPDVGLAVRFVGATAKGQPRLSDWEELEEQQRDQTRAELCRINGVELFLVDLEHAHPQEQLLQLRTILSRLARVVAHSQRPDQDKAALMSGLAAARTRLDQIVRRVHGPDDLALYTELWRDRETAAAAASRAPATPQPRPGAKPRPYRPGQAVQHSLYGAGTVIGVNGGDDPQITVQFADGRTRTFLASLAADKLVALAP